jgi:hypothetical protein
VAPGLAPALTAHPLLDESRGDIICSEREATMRSRIPLLAILLALALTGCALVTKAPPRAYAGPDMTVRIGETVTYDGSQSVDLNGGRITYYKWYIMGAPEGREDQIGVVIQEGEDTVIWTTASPVGEEDLGEWVIELKVTDDEGQSATDDLILIVIR